MAFLLIISGNWLLYIKKKKINKKTEKPTKQTADILTKSEK